MYELYMLEFIFRVRKAGIYVECYRQWTIKTRKMVNAFLAIFPTAIIFLMGIVPGWISWLLYIAGFFSVIEALSRYFPYKIRERELNKCSGIMEELSDQSINTWYEYIAGKIGEDEMNCERLRIQNILARIMTRNLRKETYPINRRISKKAENEAKQHFAEISNMMIGDVLREIRKASI